MPPLVGWAAPADAPNPWFTWDYVRQNVEYLTEALQQHVTLTVSTVVLAALFGIPMALLAYKVPWLSGAVLSTTAVMYTIPSLGLFALLGPILGQKQSTVLMGLVLYALLLVVRNALTGLRQVPGDVRDAAAGMGYGRLGLVWRIELPLALPGILTGLRLATVSTVALVTVGFLVGFGGFGDVILSGFNSNFHRAPIMVGTIGCLGLALAFDMLLLGIGRLLMPWARRAR